MTTHEFTKQQNEVIRSLSQRMRLVSILFMLIGVGLIVSLVPNMGSESRLVVLVVSAFFAVLNIIKGYVFFRPTDNLTRITTSEGKDISELMEAFAERL